MALVGTDPRLEHSSGRDQSTFVRWSTVLPCAQRQGDPAPVERAGRQRMIWRDLIERSAPDYRNGASTCLPRGSARGAHNHDPTLRLGGDASQPP